MADEKVSLEYDIRTDDVRAAEAALKSLDAANVKAAASAEKIEGATQKAGKSTAKFGQSALEVGRIVQDVVQGGLGGGINNIEGLARALGGGPGLAGVLTLVGVAVLTLKEPVKDLLESFSDAGVDVPKAADAVQRFRDEVGKLDDRLKTLKASWDGSSASLAEYQKLTAEQVDVEKKLGEAQAANAAIEAQRRKDRQGDPDSVKAMASAVTKAGGVDKVAADFAKTQTSETSAAEVQLRQVLAERDAALKAAMSRPMASAVDREVVGRQFAGPVAAAEARALEARQRAQGQANDLVGRALGGDQAAIERLNAALPGRGFVDATKWGIDQKKQRDQAVKNERAHQKRMKDRADAWQDARDLEDADAFIANTERTPEQKAARDRRRKVDKAMAPQRRADARQQAARDQAEYERGINSGLTFAEGEALAASNQALSGLERGDASESDVQRALERNRKIITELEDGDYDGGSMVLAAFQEANANIEWLANQLKAIRAQQRQFGMQFQQGRSTIRTGLDQGWVEGSEDGGTLSPHDKQAARMLWQLDELRRENGDLKAQFKQMQNVYQTQIGNMRRQMEPWIQTSPTMIPRGGR